VRAPHIAVVAYRGVLADESHAFREVFRRIPDAAIVTVGTDVGTVAGPGGTQLVTTTFRDISGVDVVVVPGGLGSHHHPDIGWWIMAAEPAWVVASSTGSALLAAAGLLRGRTAATHWLAGPLLEQHGATVSHRRVVVDEPYVTCSGRITSTEAALVVVERLGGPDLVATVRASLDDAPPGEGATSDAASHRGRHRRRRARVALLRRRPRPPTPSAV